VRPVDAARRAVFPILIALLAFAIGIALGGGPLQDEENGDSTAALERDNTALRDQVAGLRSQAVFDQGLNASLSDRLLAGQLPQRTVTLVVLPGVPAETVSATTQALESAGAQVTVVARLDEDLINPGKKTYVDSVVSASIEGAPDLSKKADHSTYAQAGALLGRAYTAHGSDSEIDDEAAKIDSELRGAKLVSVDGTPLRRGTFVVVLAPGTHGSDSYQTAQMVISHDLVQGLVDGSDATVVASTPTSSSTGGLINVLSADKSLESKRLSTVNVINSASGQTAMVFALAAAATSAPGHYGVEGDEVVLPPGLEQPGG
jgi:hypothetical protein